MSSRAFMLWSNRRGNIKEDRSHLALGRTGTNVRDIQPEEMSPLPPGAVLHYLPERYPRGRSRTTGKIETVMTKGHGKEGCLAVAVMLPNGWARTLLPAFEKKPEAPVLPFYGYTAAALVGEQMMVAAVQTEDSVRWSPFQYSTPDLSKTVKRRLKEFPKNRLLAHHAKCAVEYQCYNAQNIFYRRWEAAIAVSPACNAKCVGCISLQPEDLPPSPHERLAFVPTLEEILEIGVPHLANGGEAILSFGQGCEGEPLLKSELIARAIVAIRKETPAGTIHLNTNASSAENVARLVQAGLDSIRVSLNSVDADRYTAYYKPVGYSFADVEASVGLCQEAGIQITLNLLFFPGVNDLEDEVERLLDFIKRYGVQQVQMRNLNIDPDLYISTQPPLQGRPLGVPAFIERVRTVCAVGNSTPSRTSEATS